MVLPYKGIKINYNVVGQGRPLVFLHGFLENSIMWKETIPFFSNHYCCISIDLLGHGHTECLGYIHTMEDMARAVKAVLNHLEITKTTLVGHSMGGYVALALLDLFQDLVTGLVLLNATSLPDSAERKLNRTRAIKIVKENPNAYTNMAIASLFAEKNRLKFAEKIDAIKKEASKTSLQAIISALEGMKIRKDRSSILANFNGPKIILSGKQDPVLVHTQSIREAEHYKTSLISFNGGHMTYIENKEEFLLALQNFLAKY